MPARVVRTKPKGRPPSSSKERRKSPRKKKNVAIIIFWESSHSCEEIRQRPSENWSRPNRCSYQEEGFQEERVHLVCARIGLPERRRADKPCPGSSASRSARTSILGRPCLPRSFYYLGNIHESRGEMERRSSFINVFTIIKRPATSTETKSRKPAEKPRVSSILMTMNRFPTRLP